MEEKRNTYKILTGRPEREIPLGTPWCREEDNITMDLMERGCEGVDWIHLAQDTDRWWAVANTVMKLRTS
jgi:hypothetical protein